MQIEQSVWVEVANKTLRPSEFLLCSHCSSFTADVGSLSAHETQITLTFDSLEAKPKGGQSPNVIGHFDGPFRLLG